MAHRRRVHGRRLVDPTTYSTLGSRFMAVRRTNIPSQPPNDPLSALLDLSGSLARSSTGGVFLEALACVFAGTGLRAGVVHESTPTGLELVAAEGLPPALREHIGSMPSTAAPWFVVQHAVKRRRVLVEADVASMFGARVPAAMLRNAGWNAIACAPIVIGRDVLGAVSLAAPSAELFTPPRLVMLETVANVVALFLAREKTFSDEAPQTSGPSSLSELDEKLTRLATFGILALGFADDLRAVSAQLSSFIKHQEKWLAQLRLRHPGAAPVIRDLEPLQEEAASALMLARTSGGRLLSALEESAPEVIDAASAVYDVVGHIEPTARARNVDVLVAVQPSSDPLIRGKRSEIRQLVLGLVTDGIDACGREDKGDILAIPPPQMQIVSISVTREKNKVVLLFEHSGKSTSTEHRHMSTLRSARSREPLGLMLARNIVAGLGGSIEVTRSELGGAMVRVVLLAATPPPSSKRSKGDPPSSKQSKRGPSSSRRARAAMATIAALEAQPTTKRDGWTAKPNTLKGDQPAAIRAPAPVTVTSEDPPASEVDMLASTERGSTLAASVVPPSPRGQGFVVITDITADSGAPTIKPPSTRRRSQSGPSSKRRG